MGDQKGVVLGPRPGDAQSKEITAIPEGLEGLALKGGSGTIAALGCQRASAQPIVAQHADSVLALTGHQPTLPQAVAHFCVTGPEADAHRTACNSSAQHERGQGRVETRC